MNISLIKEKLLSGAYEFSGHAFKRVVERNIADTEIREIAENMEVIEDYPDDKYSSSCLCLGLYQQQPPDSYSGMFQQFGYAEDHYHL